MGIASQVYARPLTGLWKTKGAQIVGFDGMASDFQFCKFVATLRGGGELDPVWGWFFLDIIPYLGSYECTTASDR